MLDDYNYPVGGLNAGAAEEEAGEGLWTGHFLCGSRRELTPAGRVGELRCIFILNVYSAFCNI